MDKPLHVKLEAYSQALQKYGKQREGILVVYLFGSAARGTMDESSDLDVAVLAAAEVIPASPYEATMFRLQMQGELMDHMHTEVDLVILNTSNSIVLNYQIAKEGIPVFVRDESARIRFEMQSVRDYLDTEFMRRIYAQTVLSD